MARDQARAEVHRSRRGLILSEFLGPVGYSAPNGGIVAAAAHHIREARWLRDPRYLDDYIDYWLRGSGSGPKPATDFLNKNTTDWAHQYSFWIADAVVARASADGRWDFALDRIPELERQWEKWAPQYDEELGLYWQTPVWDAMEYTASAYQSDDPYHGGDGFRPTLNAYQYGDARAIATLLRLRGRAGDRAKAQRYDDRAAALQAHQERWLWDEEDQFYKHVMRDGNPDRHKIADREQIGFVPWYFHMAPEKNAAAWAQLTDPQGFAAPFGPTTVERRSPWFMHEALHGCCRWNGPSWPFSTSHTLTALANLLIDYPDQPYVGRADYYAALRAYALTHRKDGRLYVAEAHHPDEDRWIYDGRGHSEDYNHSTFNDLVLSGLLGIRPQRGASVEIAPLAPKEWDHFAVENLAYQGRNLTVLWDRDGTTYGRGNGLSVWLDGRRVHRQNDLDPVRLDTGRVVHRRTPPRVVDDLANVARSGYPAASASYTFPGQSRQGHRRAGPAHRHAVVTVDELPEPERHRPPRRRPARPDPRVGHPDLLLRRRRRCPNPRLLRTRLPHPGRGLASGARPAPCPGHPAARCPQPHPPRPHPHDRRAAAHRRARRGRRCRRERLAVVAHRGPETRRRDRDRAARADHGPAGHDGRGHDHGEGSRHRGGPPAAPGAPRLADRAPRNGPPKPGQRRTDAADTLAGDGSRRSAARRAGTPAPAGPVTAQRRLAAGHRRGHPDQGGVSGRCAGPE